MEVNLYLQNQFEQILKNELKDETDDVNVLNCVPKSIERVCSYHKLILSKNALDVFIGIFCRDQECFPWNTCEGFAEFEHYFLDIDSQLPSKRFFEQFTKPSVFKQSSKCKQLNLYEDADQEKVSTKTKVLGVVVTRDFKNSQSISALGFWKSDCCSLLCSTLKNEETCLVATVPNSKNNTFFITTEKGVCSIASIDPKNGSFKKLPVEFILDIPEGSIMKSFHCRRCAIEGDLILFWDCQGPERRQSFYTGINEAALNGKNVERLFRAVDEEDLQFITFTKPILSNVNGKILDEEENVLTKHSLGRVFADCTSTSAQNEKHELVVLSQSLSFVKDEFTMRVTWFCDGKTGNLDGLRVKEIVSMSIF